MSKNADFLKSVFGPESWTPCPQSVPSVLIPNQIALLHMLCRLLPSQSPPDSLQSKWQYSSRINIKFHVHNQISLMLFCGKITPFFIGACNSWCNTHPRVGQWTCRWYLQDGFGLPHHHPTVPESIRTHLIALDPTLESIQTGHSLPTRYVQWPLP